MKKKKEAIAQFEQMLRSSRRILYSVCLSFTDRTPENVDDLFQEIVSNLWQAWPRYRGDSDKTTWIYRIALNTASLEKRKRERKQRGISFIHFDENLHDIYSSDEDSHPHLEHLYQLIDRLPDDEKKLIFLHFDRLTYAQIAEISNTTESAIKQKIHRM